MLFSDIYITFKISVFGGKILRNFQIFKRKFKAEKLIESESIFLPSRIDAEIIRVKTRERLGDFFIT